MSESLPEAPAEVFAPREDAASVPPASPAPAPVVSALPAAEGDAVAAPEDAAAAPPSRLALVRALARVPAWAWLAGFAVLLFFVVPPLGYAGIWDPHELNVADLARRIALNLHGASGLALEGADNSLPHLNDLGRPQLPFTSIALGFKVFGLHEWAGRAPLALWGLLGVLATYGWVARLVDRRAGVLAGLALATMPLYLVGARTMLGDVVAMAAFSAALGGALVAAFDDDARARAAWFGVCVLGVVSGFYARGGVLGVGVPLLAASGAIALDRASGVKRDAATLVLGLATGVAGLGCVVLAWRVLGQAKVPDLSPWLGAMVKPVGKYPTFDFMVGHLGPALAPWSAFAPFALGRLFARPTGRAGAALDRESAGRAGVLLAAAIAFVAHGWLASRTDLVPFVAPAALAAAAGIALRDYERGGPPSLAVGVGTAVLLGLLHHDFHKMPEKAFHAFGLVLTTFPEGFKDRAYVLWSVSLVGFAGLLLLTFLERESDRTPFAPRRYLKTLLGLRDAWDGMLALAYFAGVAGASLAGLGLWAGTRYKWTWIPQLGLQFRELVANAWWILAIVPLAAIFGALFWCDVWIWAFGRRGAEATSLLRGFEPFEGFAADVRRLSAVRVGPRAVVGRAPLADDEAGEAAATLFLVGPLLVLQVPVLVFVALKVAAGKGAVFALALAVPSGVVALVALGLLGALVRGSRVAAFAVFAAALGLVLGGGFFPALANQLSPKEVFESYRRVARAGEPLALFGVGGRTAAYYAGGQPLVLKDADAAWAWLSEAPTGTRRFAAVRADELSRLNKLHREHAPSHANVPVLDARSSQILLVASTLAPDEKNLTPLAKIVLDEPAKPQKKLEVTLDDKLEVLGYDIVDERGRRVEAVATGREYTMRTYFRALVPIASEWQMFIHIDGNRRRHNGDHAVTQGRYPMSLWRAGDVVVDEHTFKLEPNFGAGTYVVYFGLFVGDTRMKVTKGPADSDNRVNGGAIRVQ